MKSISIHLLLLCLLAGCHRPPVLDRSPVRVAADGVAGIKAHTESAERQVQSARPHSDETGKVLLQVASEEHREVLNDAGEVRAALDAAQGKLDQLNDRLAQVEVDHAHLESRWFVVWGKWIERVLWIIGIAWLLLGIVAVVLGLGNPLGWGVWLGKEIVRLGPAMNLFAWVRNWLQRRRSVRVADLTMAGA